MVVIDTSVVLAVLLNETSRAAIVKRTRGLRVLVAPSLTWEVGNALVALVRRGRASHADIARAWTSFGQISFRVAACDVAASLRLAIDHKLYAYDAYVIEAARTARASLMTLDERQRVAAVACGVEILELS
jgi:predicted nucleic acid-binding protein